jgi:lycopene beta-cyclase
MIRGDDFFSSTLHALESNGVEFSWGCSNVEILGNAIRADNRTQTFDAVVDAAFEANTSQATLWQSFAGIWVTAQRPVFDPSAALLMDLHESSVEAPVSFLYVLPISERTALVEHTTFSPSPMPKGYHLDRCFSWIERTHGARVQPGATEYGRIPMGLQTPKAATSLTVGSAAGIVRPATGYAFVRAQEQARQVAKNILGHEPIPTHVYPRWLTLGDSLFLRALLNAPERGRQIMEGLLSRAPGDSLIAFLSGEVSPLDALSVWLSAPKGAMMRSLLRV